jgi:DNA-binding NarL/FixJ family response regulator
LHPQPFQISHRVESLEELKVVLAEEALEPVPQLMVVELPRELRAVDRVVGLARMAGVRVLGVLSDESPIAGKRAVHCGVNGLVLPVDSPSTIREAALVVASGGFMLSPQLAEAALDAWRRCREGLPRLSDRDEGIVREIGAGRSNEEIAAVLGLSSGTVQTYISKILRITGCRSKFQLCAKAHAWGLV